MDYLDSFGGWLRQRREALRLTRPELAECAGCSVSALRKIEADERRPSRQLAELLAGCLRILPEEQSLFLDAARGARPVARLGLPAPRVIPQPLPTPPGPSGVSSSDRIAQPAWNLPSPATPLIGREAELATLTDLLEDPDCRLLTLAGPGGIGKSRLAIEVAGYVWERFADGVFLASLEATSSPKFMVPAIAQAIGLNFAGPADPRLQLVNYFSNKQVLLLLDNLEHLLDGVELVVEMLERAPRLKLLATSRERLELSGEWVFEVQGLPVPAEGEVEGLETYSSIQLFLQRARQAQVDFELSVEDYPDIVRICRLVEGMPLAIELAATWVPVLSCPEIAEEIERGLNILTTRLRDVPERQRSLRAVFDHSYKLLTEDDQGVLLRLSVFRGGFQREAAEAVADATLPVLSTLVMKSLIRRSSAGRFDLHELIRQFAAEHLAERAEEQSATQARHARYYLAFFGQAYERLRSSAQQKAIEELTNEMDNFRTAWDWAVRHKEFVLIGAAQFGYTGFFDMRGWLHEGVEHLDQVVHALENSEGIREDAVLAHVLSNKGMLAFRMGNHETARDSLDKSIALIRPLNEPRILVEALVFRAVVGYILGDYHNALTWLDEGMEVANSIQDKWFEALYLFNYALISSAVQPIENTYDKLLQSLILWRETGDPRFTALALNFASLSAVAMGRFAEAQSMLEECLAITTSISDRWGEGIVYRHMGLLAGKQNEYAQAKDLFRKSLDLFTELGAQWDVARALTNLGETELAMGETNQAENHLLEAFRISVKSQGIPDALEALVGFASLQRKRGELEHALELLWLVLNHPASLQETKNRAIDLQAELEAQLTSQQVEAARERAQTKTLETVVEEVLKQV